MLFTNHLIRRGAKIDKRFYNGKISPKEHLRCKKHISKLLSIAYNLTAWMPIYSLSKKKIDNPKVIVSLTSFPRRLETLWMVIESILRQKYKPSNIILWLNTEEMKGIKIPKKLSEQQERGLVIKYINSANLRPHGKYFHAMQEYPNDIIITIDDDHVYNNKLISRLVALYNKFPQAICCAKSHVITFTNDGTVKPYNTWMATPTPRETPSLAILATGVGGVLYPPHSLHPETFNTEAIIKNALPVDDLWLKAGAVLNGTKVVRTNRRVRAMPLIIENDISLQDTNVGQSENDKYLKLIRTYFSEKIGRDPIEELRGTFEKDITTKNNI